MKPAPIPEPERTPPNAPSAATSEVSASSAADASSANAASGAGSSSSADDDSNGLFGPFRVGFLLGGGLPDLVSLGGTLKLTRFFGAGINIGLIPTVRISLYGDAKLAFQEYDAYGRIYPFGGAFFLGAGVGYASMRGSLATHFDLSSYQKMYPGAGIPASLDVTSQASVRTLVLTPQLGLLHTFDSGFSLGADVGAQVPIAPSQVDFATVIPPNIPTTYKSEIQKQYIDPNDAKVSSSLHTVGRTVIPTFNIKFGFLF